MFRGSVSASVAVAIAYLAAPLPAAWAGPTWDGIRAEVYGTRPIQTGGGQVTLEAPYRPEDVRSVPLAADIRLPEGETIKSVAFIVDENPSPVAAVYTLGEGRNAVHLSANIRLNQQSDVRVVVETAAGRLLMAERLVKFAGGQASCSAPPQGDPAEIAANMGKMSVSIEGAAATASHQRQRAKVTLSHPNHTGMVMDQISLLYIPLLMVEAVEIRQGGELIATVKGSITLAQNPVFGFDFMTNGASEIEVTARDTSGAEWRKSFPIGPAS